MDFPSFSPESAQAVAILLAVALVVGFALGRFVRFLAVKKERGDAVRRSQSTILGNVYEKIVPLLPGFRYSPKDLVFVGKGFDYLVVDGLSEWTVREIVFLEVKTGASTLNANERRIKDAVNGRRVRWEEYRPKA